MRYGDWSEKDIRNVILDGDELAARITKAIRWLGECSCVACRSRMKQLQGPLPSQLQAPAPSPPPPPEGPM